MFSRIKNRFCSNPSMYYSMSIAATWAGVGSLIIGTQMAQQHGILPFLIWALGNVAACIVFGIFAPIIPKLREVFHSKTMHLLVGIVCIFQVWVNMNGIQAIFVDTALTGTFGMWLAYVVAIVFIILLVRYGMIRNVLTDHASWFGVYVTILALTILAIIYSQGNMVSLAWGAKNSAVGIEKAILLLPGAFLYPYFFGILDYNEHNKDGIKKINVTRAFTIGGLLFGIYLCFVFLLAFTHFSPALNLVKAFLITLIAVSTISSFLYSIYITFGRTFGIFVNIATVLAWQYVIPLGVMGVWTLMGTVRIFIVIGAILFALVWACYERKKAVAA